MTFHSIERLGPPFHSVSEVGVVIPRGGRAEVANIERKLLFFLEADCLMTIPGAGDFPIRKGDICVIPRRCLQHYRLDGKRQSPRVHALKITLALPPLPGPGERARRRAAPGDPERDLTAFAQHHFGEIQHWPAAQDATMQESIRAIRAEAEQHRPGIRHRVRALCADLLVHVARQQHETPRRAQATGTGFGFIVTQTKEFLLRNVGRELTLGDVAWQVKKSEEHLARVFRKVTGQTVFDYLRTIRLESAKTLLFNSDLTLTEIAARTGFSSLALFSRNFTQYVGRNPSAYRQARAEAFFVASNSSRRSRTTRKINSS
jgi:AraC-like DNA-binding protein